MHRMVVYHVLFCLFFVADSGYGSCHHLILLYTYQQVLHVKTCNVARQLFFVRFGDWLIMLRLWVVIFAQTWSVHAQFLCTQTVWARAIRLPQWWGCDHAPQTITVHPPPQNAWAPWRRSACDPAPGCCEAPRCHWCSSCYTHLNQVTQDWAATAICHWDQSGSCHLLLLAKHDKPLLFFPHSWAAVLDAGWASLSIRSSQSVDLFWHTN